MGNGEVGTWNGERLVYLRGYRDGSEAERIKLLKDALMGMVKGIVLASKSTKGVVKKGDSGYGSDRVG
jgi:hypothetical protein